METAVFTLRDLNRRLAKVLETCDRLGSVRVRLRGKIYELKPESPGSGSKVRVLPDFAARSGRMAKLAGRKSVVTKRGWTRLSRLIASAFDDRARMLARREGLKTNQT